jgi:serine/threonine-protein kinase GIN4
LNRSWLNVSNRNQGFFYHTLMFFSSVESQPAPSLRLSACVDPSIFIAPSTGPLPSLEGLDPDNSRSFDGPDSSMLQIEPYPTRQVMLASPALLDESTQRYTEAVYDRFLMATAGVKRNGKGYCSDHISPPQSNTENSIGYGGGAKLSRPRTRRSMTFGRTATGVSMKPPVGFTKVRTASCDELGMFSTPATTTSSTGSKEPAKQQGTFVRRALKAVTGGMRRTVLA